MSISFLKYYVCGHNMDYIKRLKGGLSQKISFEGLRKVCEGSDC